MFLVTPPSLEEGPRPACLPGCLCNACEQELLADLADVVLELHEYSTYGPGARGGLYYAGLVAFYERTTGRAWV